MFAPIPTEEQIARLNDVIADLKAHPEKHHQQQWFMFKGEPGSVPPVVTPTLDCGSAFCIAGAVIARAGAQPKWKAAHSFEYDGSFWYAETVTLPDGRERWAWEYAAELLGLPQQVSNELFSANNSMKDIEAIRDKIVAGTFNYEPDEW